MLCNRNCYCSGEPCHCTREFLDRGTYYICRYCGKRLEKNNERIERDQSDVHTDGRLRGEGL